MKMLQNLLFVDDESHVRKFISTLVHKVYPGITLHEASSCAAALDLFQQVKPELVLLDINMPGVDGFATLKLLKALDASCEVIMLTSIDIGRTVQTVIEIGAAGYIHKDCDYREMEASVTALVQRLFPEWSMQEESVVVSEQSAPPESDPPEA
ncbi:MAG: DNA-binding NarL/FixJ family response regulator [Lentimonas sp.]|jgi:DNA-binding NarL/FixJ family response regulator